MKAKNKQKKERGIKNIERKKKKAAH